MIWTIPNILTIARIVAAPCVALVFVLFERPLADWLAFGLFVGAALTDFLDGWIARRFNQMSELGKMLDPIADKAMVVVGLMVLLAHAQPMSFSAGYTITLFAVPAAVIGTREVLISGIREYLGDIKLPVTMVAKCKTAVQLVAVGAGLFMGVFEPAVNRAYFEFLLSGGQQFTYMGPQEAFFHQVYFVTGVATTLLLWLAAILTVISGWGYVRQAILHLRTPEVF
ncbi:MAG: CDP-diacylglycerol--glycerol-3-phosphate 3-phosphatidyltransferase [Paracoccaceae bacterium]